MLRTSTLKMETAQSSEMLESNHHTTPHYTTIKLHVLPYQYENFKSHNFINTILFNNTVSTSGVIKHQMKCEDDHE
jgi:hypothetical protein